MKVLAIYYFQSSAAGLFTITILLLRIRAIVSVAEVDSAEAVLLTHFGSLAIKEEANGGQSLKQ
jgi:hypothetical protein